MSNSKAPKTCMGLSAAPVENARIEKDCGGVLRHELCRAFAIYEHDPIRQPGRGGLLNINPAGAQSGRLVAMPETGWELTDPVVSGSETVSNFWDQR